eukprot:s1436_g3.t2
MCLAPQRRALLRNRMAIESPPGQLNPLNPLNPGLGSPTHLGMPGSPAHLGMPGQDPWMDPMWQSRPLNTSFFQVDLPRTDGIFHNQASFSAQPHPQVNPTPVTPVREQAGVVQAELAGPVQVEAPPISGTKEDGWDRIADAIGTPALNPLRAELTR